MYTLDLYNEKLFSDLNIKKVIKLIGDTTIVNSIKTIILTDWYEKYTVAILTLVNWNLDLSFKFVWII